MSRKALRNPIERDSFENPAGDVMKELTELELDVVSGGIDYKSNRNSCGYFCTITGECQGTKTGLCCG